MANSPNLGIPHIVGSSANQYITANEAIDDADRAANDDVSIVVAGNFSLTAAEFNENWYIELTGTPGAFIADTPANKRAFVIDNSTDGAATIRCNGAGVTRVVAVGEVEILYCDGTDIKKVANFLDAVTTIPAVKKAVRAATTAAGTLATDFENGDGIDGVTLATGDRILIKDQASAIENGIYTVNASGAPTRATDFDSSGNVFQGAGAAVLEGDENALTLWAVSTTGTIAVGTDAINFKLIAGGAGASGIKQAVRAATAAAGTLATSFENGDAIDGVTLATGDRILIKDQAAAAENGIYTVNASGAPTRAVDFNENGDPTFGDVIPVVEGTDNGNTIWQLETAGPYTIDTTGLTFGQAGGGTATPAKGIKQAVRAATVASGTLATSFENGDTIDAVVLATGDRILIKDQTASAENGIYTVNASGAPTRATDFDEDTDPVFGDMVPVVEGTVNANTGWQLETAGPYTIDTTNLTFGQFGTGGGVAGTKASVQFVIDGGGSAIGTGIKGYVEVPFAGTITAVRMLADQTGSAVVDIWKDTYANYPPVDADSITASAVPTITSSDKSEDTTLTGWTTSVAAGDILGFNVDSAATITRLTLSLTISRT